MKKKTVIKALLSIFSIALIFLGIYNYKIIYNKMELIFKKRIIVPEEYSKLDLNKNSIPDPIDIVNSARKEAKIKTKYISNYYQGGYPPEGEGVCTDVIWRGFKGANINIKDLMDEDIKSNTTLYPRVNNKPDPNIDFRRVLNQNIFFKRFCYSLTTEVKPWDIGNLKQWQPGDIIVFLEGYEHVGIISDKRDKDGVPYVIHNSYPHASEAKLSWFKTPIYAHYRWKYD